MRREALEDSHNTVALLDWANLQGSSSHAALHVVSASLADYEAHTRVAKRALEIRPRRDSAVVSQRGIGRDERKVYGALSPPLEDASTTIVSR